MSKEKQSLPTRIKEHPVIATILLIAALIGAISTILAWTMGSLCWLQGGGKGCSKITAEIFSPTPYMFDGTVNRQVLKRLIAMDGVRAEVNLDLHKSTGPGESFLSQRCPDINFNFAPDRNDRVRVPLFIGEIESEFPDDGDFENYVKDVSCVHDFVNIVLPKEQLVFSSSGGGTGVGINYLIRGDYLINVASWAYQARRYYEIILKK